MKPPIAYTVFLPPSHPFMKMSDAEFADLWGANIARKTVEPIANLKKPRKRANITTAESK